MLYMESEQLQGNDDKDFLRLMFEKLPPIKQMDELDKGFRQLFVTKEDGLLKNWIQEPLKSECGLKNFAKNLLKDYEAINNAVITHKQRTSWGAGKSNKKYQKKNVRKGRFSVVEKNGSRKVSIIR